MDDPGPDVHNFSPTQHRLPTVSGVEALKLASEKAKSISTGLPTLDGLLLPNELSLATPGLQRGCVTEIFGPPGVGKTAFGLQVATNAMTSTHDESHVLWINCGSPLTPNRLRQLMAGHRQTQDPKLSPPGALNPPDTATLVSERFTYLEAHSLPRLLTIFLHPSQTLPGSKTSLIVVDDLSNLILGSFSRSAKHLKPGAPAVVKEKFEKRAAGRRFQIIESLGAAMSKMATLGRLAILALTNSTISLKTGQKAMLKPALSSQAWDTAINTRIMLYRDFPDKDQEPQLSKLETRALRYAEVQRLGRKETRGPPVAFVILADGLRQLHPPEPHDQEEEDIFNAFHGTEEQRRPPQIHLPLLPDEISQPPQPKKRKATEIADSEDEEETDDGDGDGDERNGKADASVHAEPKLPTLPTLEKEIIIKKEEEEDNDDDDEMILDAHEAALLRSYRHAIIRGSEDAIPISSDEEEEEGDDDDEDEGGYG
ncbi:hypothetical protein PV08_03991 [Exophiala spinifera]|uniref:RecA family profile 1 domain-containing protein n=1 Tax=Exophiala spinifera TaxID=91928 RepID=A0A0D1YNU8_9EURO|nr:uncharacterized protein PV08_03991 [Exophiala spinifera]KIW16801.1 hypothetical protein PV08_03991 [Exophiala spinifera]